MKIKILGPVDHDGKRLEVGDSVNLPDRAARDLVASGAAELEGKQKAAVPADEGSGQRDGAGDEQEGQP